MDIFLGFIITGRQYIVNQRFTVYLGKLLMNFDDFFSECEQRCKNDRLGFCGDAVRIL